MRIPRSWSLDKIEIASAAPSVGSVPAHNSSNKTKDFSLACFKIDTIFVIWEEKVLKFCSILCSSPISANTSSKTASSERSFAGIWSPAAAIIENNPMVFFNDTVLPPVFGPVTIRRSNVSPSITSIGTTFFGFNSGCLPFRILMRPLVLKIGATPLWIFANCAFAKIKSNVVKIL